MPQPAVSDPTDVFLRAAQSVIALVERVPPEAWSGPGLGAWDLRSLVGHAGRAIVTLVDYLAQDADQQAEIHSAAGYFVAARQLGDAGEFNELIRLRGVAAGASLGDDPAATLRAWLDQARSALRQTPLDRVIPTIAGPMTVAAYLPTRVFELVVHGIDIADALGMPPNVPADGLATALDIAATVAVTHGQGPDVLRALTGRTALPDDFSVVL